MASIAGPLEGASAHNSPHGTPGGRDERAGAYRPSPQCPTACTGCDPQTGDTKAALDSERPLQGVSLVVASIGYFLLPLAAALLGAILAGEGPLRQLAGAGTGLLGATLIAALFSGIVQRHRSETP
jgi:hypothetical protein